MSSAYDCWTMYNNFQCTLAFFCHLAECNLLREFYRWPYIPWNAVIRDLSNLSISIYLYIIIGFLFKHYDNGCNIPVITGIWGPLMDVMVLNYLG